MSAPKEGVTRSPRLITFDFGDTLVTSEPSYLHRVMLGLGELGHRRTLEEVMQAYFEADLNAADKLLPAAPFEPEEFKNVFSGGFFKGLGLLDKATELSQPLARFLIDFRPRRVNMPGAMKLLEILHDRGYALGIISNNDGHTREKCEATGIDKYFMFILDSTIEGIMKPDPRLFIKALGISGIRARDMLHVGDLWGCDVMGPHSAGIHAVWLENEYIDPPHLPGAARIGRLLDLLDLVDE